VTGGGHNFRCSLGALLLIASAYDISARNRVAQLHPWAGSLLSPLTARRDYGGGILTRLHTGSSNLEGQVPVFISPRNRMAQLYPRALGSLLSPLTTRRAAN
jgi:hypothetical protein